MKPNPKRTSAKAVKKVIAQETKAVQVQTNKADESFEGVATVEMSRTIVLADGRKVQPVIANQEATSSAMADDKLRGNNVSPQRDIDDATKANAGEVKLRDELMLSPDCHAWNQGANNTVESQTLDNNVLTKYNVIPVALTLPSGRKSRYQALVCSDNGIEVGKPFADSYTLLDNPSFLSVIGDILNVIEKLGHKARIASSGTLMERERQFVSIQLLDIEDLKVDDKRTIKAFINCLNSIPSNSGCTVTFANNCFVVCCRNTFSHALRKTDDTEFHASLKHCKGLRPMLKDVPVMIESYISGNVKLLGTLKAFAAFPVGLVDAEQVFSAFIARTGKNRLPAKSKDVANFTADKFMELAGFNVAGELSTRSANMVERLQTLFVRGDGNKGESALDLFQAVTQYYTHESAGDSDNAMKQIQSSEVGSGAIAKSDFFDMLVAMTQAKSHWQGVAKVGETILVSYRNKPAKK